MSLRAYQRTIQHSSSNPATISKTTQAFGAGYERTSIFIIPSAMSEATNGNEIHTNAIGPGSTIYVAVGPMSAMPMANDSATKPTQYASDRHTSIDHNTAYLSIRTPDRVANA